MHSAFEVEFVLLVYVNSVAFAVYVVNSDFLCYSVNIVLYRSG